MIPGNQPNNDPISSIADDQMPLFEAAFASDEVGTSAVSANDLNDLADQESKCSLQGHNHPLSVQVLNNEAESTVAPKYSTSSRSRKWTMSCWVQDATSQGLLQNFNQTILSTALHDQPIFLGNDFDIWHDHELAMQECMCHPIAFHAQMMGGIMYWHQFIEAMVKEVNDHTKQNTGVLI